MAITTLRHAALNDVLVNSAQRHWTITSAIEYNAISSCHLLQSQARKSGIRPQRTDGRWSAFWRYTHSENRLIINTESHQIQQFKSQIPTVSLVDLFHFLCKSQNRQNFSIFTGIQVVRYKEFITLILDFLF